MPRAPLPPPPPPPHLRIWPDRATLLADRALALELLRGRHLGVRRLGLLWLTCLVAICGWSGIAGAVQQARGGFPDIVVAAFVAVIGLALLTPAVVIAVLGIRKDRQVRQLLDAWAALDSDPVVDARLRSPALSLSWMLLSFVPCALGIWASFGSAAAADGSDAVLTVLLGMGAGMLLWVTGLLGIAKAMGHRKWIRARFRKARSIG